MKLLFYSFIERLFRKIYHLPFIMVNIHQAALEDALKKCSLEQMYEAYMDSKILLEIGRVKSFVTPDDILNDKVAARKKMTMQLKFHLRIVRNLPLSYWQMVQSQLRALGGIQITLAEKSGGSFFAYTIGYTDVGGSELLYWRIYIVWWQATYGTLVNWLYKRHLDGYPLFPTSLYKTRLALLSALWNARVVRWLTIVAEITN